MRYFKKRRLSNSYDPAVDDPLSGVANLFDLGVAVIVGLFLAFLTAFQVMDFFSPKAEITIMKKNEIGQMEIITKKGKEVKIERIADKKISGEEGIKLGTAYKLKDGKVIYVPEE